MNKFDDEVAKIMRQGMPEEEHIHIAKHTESTYRWANQNLQAMRSWVIDLQVLLDQPVGKVDVRGFYIGLHGIIGDMYLHFVKQVAFQKKLTGKKKIDALKAAIKEYKNISMRLYVQEQITVYEIISDIHLAFSIKERRQIQFFRHKYCHPILTGFAVKIEIDEDTGERYFDNTKKYNDFVEISESKPIDYFDNLYSKLENQKNNLEKLQTAILRLQTS